MQCQPASKQEQLSEQEKILVPLHLILIISHLEHCFQLQIAFVNIAITKGYSVQGMVRSVDETLLKEMGTFSLKIGQTKCLRFLDICHKEGDFIFCCSQQQNCDLQ